MTEVVNDTLAGQQHIDEPSQQNDETTTPNVQLDDFKELNDGQQDSDPQDNDLSPQCKSEEDEETSPTKPQQQLFTRDLIDVNRSSINFNRNTLFPGSIEEIDVSVSLKDFFEDEASPGPFFLRIMVTCHNSEFNDLDQYVYSVRSNQRYEYYDEVHFKIKNSDRAEFKVAVKIPVCKQNQTIDGTLSIQLQNSVPIFLPIISKCEIPNITCLKLLQNIDNVQMIKIPAKKGAKLPPLPFKNLSSYTCYFEVETITTEDMSKRPFDLSCPSSIVCTANSPFFVMLQLKINPLYDEPIGKTDVIRKILVLKVRNSSLYFSYPIEVYVYESSNGSSTS